MSKIIMYFVISSLLFSACSVPTPSSVSETKIIEEKSTIISSQTPSPTATPFYTETPNPTSVPTAELTPTIELDFEATKLATENIKEFFSKSTLEMFGDALGCVIADWNEDSFDLVCVNVGGITSDQELTEVAFKLTHGLGNQMFGLEMNFCFDEGFSFIVTLMTDDETRAVRTVTPGNVIKLLIDKKITTQSEWEALSTIDLRDL